MPKCEIQWIDSAGNPTPDDNLAIGETYIEAHVWLDRRGEGHVMEQTRRYCVCAEHAKRIKGHWVFVPYKRICVSYEVVTHESADDNDVAERGWEDQIGERCEADPECGETEVSEAIRKLSNDGVCEASSSEFHPGVWYIGHPETNYRTGAETTYSYHLKGFTESEEREIYDAVTKGRS